MGGVIDSGNTFNTSAVAQAIEADGNTDQQNANDTYGPDVFTSGANDAVCQLYNGGGNVYNAPDVNGCK